jgi:hypothetical protein
VLAPSVLVLTLLLGCPLMQSVKRRMEGKLVCRLYLWELYERGAKRCQATARDFTPPADTKALQNLMNMGGRPLTLIFYVLIGIQGVSIFRYVLSGWKYIW